MIAAADRADLAEQLAEALDLAVEANFEAARLLRVVRVLARRLADPQVEVDDMNSDEDDKMEEMQETEELAAADGVRVCPAVCSCEFCHYLHYD